MGQSQPTSADTTVGAVLAGLASWAVLCQLTAAVVFVHRQRHSNGASDWQSRLRPGLMSLWTSLLAGVLPQLVCDAPSVLGRRQICGSIGGDVLGWTSLCAFYASVGQLTVTTVLCHMLTRHRRKSGELCFRKKTVHRLSTMAVWLAAAGLATVVKHSVCEHRFIFALYGHVCHAAPTQPVPPPTADGPRPAATTVVTTSHVDAKQSATLAYVDATVALAHLLCVLVSHWRLMRRRRRDVQRVEQEQPPPSARYQFGSYALTAGFPFSLSSATSPAAIEGFRGDRRIYTASLFVWSLLLVARNVFHLRLLLALTRQPDNPKWQIFARSVVDLAYSGLCPLTYAFCVRRKDVASDAASRPNDCDSSQRISLPSLAPSTCGEMSADVSPFCLYAQRDEQDAGDMSVTPALDAAMPLSRVANKYAPPPLSLSQRSVVAETSRRHAADVASTSDITSRLNSSSSATAAALYIVSGPNSGDGSGDCSPTMERRRTTTTATTTSTESSQCRKPNAETLRQLERSTDRRRTVYLQPPPDATERRVRRSASFGDHGRRLNVASASASLRPVTPIVRYPGSDANGAPANNAIRSFTRVYEAKNSAANHHLSDVDVASFSDADAADASRRGLSPLDVPRLPPVRRRRSKCAKAAEMLRRTAVRTQTAAKSMK